MKNKSLIKSLLTIIFISLFTGCGDGGSSSQITKENVKIYSKNDVFIVKRGQKIVILEQDTTYTSSTNASTNETTISVTKGKLSLN
jgi:hypothetical protein